MAEPNGRKKRDQIRAKFYWRILKIEKHSILFDYYCHKRSSSPFEYTEHTAALIQTVAVAPDTASVEFISQFFLHLIASLFFDLSRNRNRQACQFTAASPNQIRLCFEMAYAKIE